MNAAIVPIKSLAAGKSRLEGTLDREQLEALCLAMMRDVVSALLESQAFDRVVVVTPDEEAAEAARRMGAEAFLGPDPGLNPAMSALMLVIMTPVELIGKLAKPFALAVRLFANMTAGHFVLLALLGLIITYGSFTTGSGWIAILGPILLGLFVMFLEIFVAFLQAFIFAMLTSVFVGLIRHAH